MKKFLSILAICVIVLLSITSLFFFFESRIAHHQVEKLENEQIELKKEIDKLKEELKPTSQEQDKNKDKDTTGKQDGYDTSAFKEIKASEIAAESKNETIVLWVGRQGCGYCAQYAPVIAQAGKKFGITIRYIDLGKMLSVDESTQQFYLSDPDSFDTIANLKGDGEWYGFAKQNMGGTPLTLIVKNNKVIGGINQAESLKNVEKAFEAAGLQKK